MIPIKTPKEIEKMRVAGRLAAEVLQKTAAIIKPGITTREVDEAAGQFMAEAGCESAFLNYRGFPGQLCISLNEEVVHGIGGNRRIQVGDIVKLDVGVRKDGYYGDNATTIAVGLVNERVQRLLEITEASLYEAIRHAVEGKRLGDVGAAVEEMVIAHGFNVVREFVGHGIGKRLHEEPQIPNYGRRGSGPKLKAGMVLAIEPMVNMGTSDVRILSDGWTVVTKDSLPSAHFEHTVLVTKGEPEILTWRERT